MTKPRPEWSREKQPDPPNFGQARLIPKWRLNLAVWQRRKRALRIVSQGERHCSYKEGMVSLVVLSCKRLPEFKRLCETLKPFFEKVEDYPLLEKILVDNGSGDELVSYARELDFFDKIIAHEENLGMAKALNDAYKKCEGEYITLIEDDMVVEYNRPYIKQCLDVLKEYPEIGIVRLKNQNNWWKPGRIISPERKTSTGVDFWTWLPSRHGDNVWACGSTLFRKTSFFSTGLLETGEGREQAYIVENVYAKKYNKTWLAAKIKNCYPVIQPNDNTESPGFSDKLLK